MLLELTRRGYPLHEVCFFNTGMEFQAIYYIQNKVLPLLFSPGIRYTEFDMPESFEYLMFDKPVDGPNGFHYGYSWCGGPCRWVTALKLQCMDSYAKQTDAIVYVAYAADEKERQEKNKAGFKRYPLIDWGCTEADALAGCYDAGYDWMESGFRLYDLLDRVSCWCCANKNRKELRNIYRYLPEYWQRLRDLQNRTERPMKGEGWSVLDLESLFKQELNQAMFEGYFASMEREAIYC